MKIQNLSFFNGVALAAMLLAVPTFAAAKSTLRPTDRSVLESYQKIETALAADSLKAVSENAEAISKAIQRDPGKRIPLDIAQHADKLATDKDLKTARDDFKNLSAALISYLEKSDVKGLGYQENYCPMVKANWLQKDKKVNNPYLGKSMSTCGTLKKSF